MQYVDRKVSIVDDKGAVVCEWVVAAPPKWSDTAVSIVASKYLAKHENSIEQMFDRVVNAITEKGEELGYFTEASVYTNKEEFRAALLEILYNQEGSFNSPVWFNVGVRKDCAASACFISGIEDDMDSIMEFANLEARIFKFGGGLGGNLSNIRSKNASLSDGGTASGPTSFMEVYDAVAGIVKSGGKTRRAALMLELEATHPDILDFVTCKQKEEHKARALRHSGLEGTVRFQNANLSVQLTDDFMENLEDNEEVFDAICKAAWDCGDPGVQFIDTINLFNTCPESGRIRSSNPCGEFLFLDESACNLASINLLKFVRADGSFKYAAYTDVICTLVVAMDIIVELATYPSEKIGENSRRFRPLGLGYSNLGSVLMRRDSPYGSVSAIEFVENITEHLHKTAFQTSEILAKVVGPFEGYQENKKDVDSVYRDQLRLEGPINGVRNAQLTLLAPTGTISFMMDCDTFGIEPEFSLVKYKNLIGGGVIKTVNKEAEAALKRHSFEAAVATLKETGELVGVSEDVERLLATAMKGLTWKNHIDMMAAAQKYLSGAISKTINLPSTATVQDVKDVIKYAFESGLKSVTVYRDGCKGSQPLTTGSKDSPEKTNRTRMADTRAALTHKFSIGGHEGYLTVGLYEDGTPGEIFISCSKAGSTLSGLLSAFSISVSIGLQCGTPLQTYIDKFSHVEFQPNGITKNPDIRFAKSIVDYVFRWMDVRFNKTTETSGTHSGELCQDCGGLMVRVGACSLCTNCGTSGGCS